MSEPSECPARFARGGPDHRVHYTHIDAFTERNRTRQLDASATAEHLGCHERSSDGRAGL